MKYIIAFLCPIGYATAALSILHHRWVALNEFSTDALAVLIVYLIASFINAIVKEDK